MAVGADYPIATSLLAEFTPRRYRGPLQTARVVLTNTGSTDCTMVGFPGVQLQTAHGETYLDPDAVRRVRDVVFAHLGLEVSDPLPPPAPA